VTKKPTKPAPKRKAGRPAERLVITDPQSALDRLLKPVKRVGAAMKRLRDNSTL
jgi:hypothetical protein